MTFTAPSSINKDALLNAVVVLTQQLVPIVQLVGVLDGHVAEILKNFGKSRVTCDRKRHNALFVKKYSSSSVSLPNLKQNKSKTDV